MLFQSKFHTNSFQNIDENIKMYQYLSVFKMKRKDRNWPGYNEDK